MPRISLVVCIYNQRDLLERLLNKSQACYDDLLVVHDGPDIGNVREIVEKARGRFIENVRLGSLESQSPFAWERAAHDWILRLDADEFPSDEMQKWLRQFRESPEPPKNISGYTCVWPLWNGERAVTRRWPAGRIFLFNRQQVRFFGLVEQTPIPEGRYEPLPMTLHHQPGRKSHGLRNLLMRKQAYRWRSMIARGLLGKPTDLPCWRWDSEVWPERWEQVRRHPLRTAVTRLVMETLRGFRDQWKIEKRILPSAAIMGPLHHAMFCFQFWRLRSRQAKN